MRWLAWSSLQLPKGKGGEFVVAAMLFLSLTLGGGGTDAPETEVPLECLLGILAILPLVSRRARQSLGRPHWTTWLLTGLVVSMPIAHLIPLPPSVWQSLPGRANEIAVLRLVGQEQTWMPLSMAPTRTFAALLAMIAGLLVMIHVGRLDLHGRTRMMGIVILVSGLSIGLGALQMAHVGGMKWMIYREFHENWLIGFDANRNAETDLLQVAILAVALTAAAAFTDAKGDTHKRARSMILALVGFVVFSIAVMLTGSRGGFLLYPLTVAFFLAILWRPLRSIIPNLRWLMIAGSVFLVAAAFVLPRFEAIQRLIDRFDFSREARLDIWIDTLDAIGRVWPAGGGVGTFSSVVQQSERLEVVDQTVLVRAHNDWLEWVLESGAPGLAVLATIFVTVVWLAILTWRQPSISRRFNMHRAQALFAVGTLVHIGLHAIIDYPTRSMALVALIALAVGMLLPNRQSLRQVQ